MPLTAMRPGLAPLLEPRSVAVIGASRDATKRGHQIVRALIDSGFPGTVHPVNPSGGELLGLAVSRSILEIGTQVDLAVICTPATTVPQVLRDCATAGVRAAISLAVGFGESGVQGRLLEQEIASIARETGIRLCGPNTSGLINTRLGLNLIGIKGVRAGSTALLVQSGNLLLQMATEATARTDGGFSYCIGVGNETDIGFHEYLRHLAADDGTRAILLHTEGFRDGRAFLAAAQAVTRAKPIVLLKGARTSHGGQVAQSHTGAVAGEYPVLRAALAQVGVIEVTRSDELLHVGQTLASQPPLAAGKGIALLSDGGGHAAIAADALGDVPMAQLADSTREALRQLLGPAAAVSNPIDLAGAADADPLVFARTLEQLAADPAVGCVFVVGLFGGYALRFAASLHEREVAAANAMVECATKHNIGLVVHSLYAAARSESLQGLTRANVPVIESLEVACRCTTALAERGAILSRPDSVGLVISVPNTQPDAIIGAVADGRNVLLEPESHALLQSFGVPLVSAQWCRTAAEAADAAARLGSKLVLKAVSPDIMHKSDSGAVVLNVAAPDAAQTFDDLSTRMGAYTQDYRGALVAPMLPTPVLELLVGVRRDPQFGPVLVIGAGGTLVEVLHDVSLRVLPVVPADIEAMLEELAIAPLLHGARGRPIVRKQPIVDAVLAIAEAALAVDAIESIEINPLFVYADHVAAVDARTYLVSAVDHVHSLPLPLESENV